MCFDDARDDGDGGSDHGDVGGGNSDTIKLLC